jgi:hypothetical protein
MLAVEHQHMGLRMVDPNNGVKRRHGDPFKNQAGCCFSKWVWHIRQRKVCGAADGPTALPVCLSRLDLAPPQGVQA